MSSALSLILCINGEYVGEYVSHWRVKCQNRSRSLMTSMIITRKPPWLSLDLFLTKGRSREVSKQENVLFPRPPSIVRWDCRSAFLSNRLSLTLWLAKSADTTTSPESPVVDSPVADSPVIESPVAVTEDKQSMRPATWKRKQNPGDKSVWRNWLQVNSSWLSTEMAKKIIQASHTSLRGNGNERSILPVKPTSPRSSKAHLLRTSRTSGVSIPIPLERQATKSSWYTI